MSRYYLIINFIFTAEVYCFCRKKYTMSIHSIPALKDCYIMQHEDIERFADTLADGFSRYNLFEHICNDKYDHDKMKLFWAVSVALIYDNAICIADSKDVNSVLIYVRPKSK